MLFDFAVRYLFGIVSIKSVGGLHERLLNEAAQRCIGIKNIVMYDDGFTAQMSNRHYEAFINIAKKNRCEIKLLERKGVYVRAQKLKKRYGITLGVIGAVAFALLSQNMVWNIKFYDFTKEQEIKMRTQLYQFDIYEGAIITIDKLNMAEDDIVINSEDYGWVSLNFINGRIIVEKNDRKPHSNISDTELTNVVAMCDGIVKQIDVSGGFLQVSEGQSVAKGDVLVSASRQDASGNLMYTHAEGKIFAETEKIFEIKIPLKVNITLPGSEEKRYYSILALNKTIDLYKNMQQSGEYVERVNKYPLSIWGLSLPCTVICHSLRQKYPEYYDISIETALNIARVRIIDALQKELPGAKTVTTTESFVQQGDYLIVRQKILARANIAQIVKMQ